ncbi:helix-turn-helix domain-containing protein [Carnobacterium maltaromaticum]
MEEKRSYYAIIPANVRYDSNLTPNAKLLYGEITALCNEKGYCWASNNYFAELYGVSKKAISTWINQLTERGYLHSEMKYQPNSKKIEYRYLRIGYTPMEENFHTPQKKTSTPYGTKLPHPMEEKVKDNITSNNTVNTTFNKDNTSNKDSMEVLFKKIWAIYPKKTLRQSGLAAYKKAIKKGVTHEEIEQGVLNYVAYQKLNSSWLKPMDGGRWFQRERWTDEYDMTPPKAYNNSQQSVRTESLPDWAKDDFVAPQTIEDNSEEARQKALEELNSIGRN